MCVRRFACVNRRAHVRGTRVYMNLHNTWDIRGFCLYLLPVLSLSGGRSAHSLLLSFLFLWCKSEKAETRKLLMHRIFRVPIFAGARKRKSSEILEFQSFALICYLLSRCVRDSNPWPHAWQACILTNWTNAPLFHSFVAISLDCGCKGRHFFDICNSYGELFSKRFVLYLLYILILRRLEK